MTHESRPQLADLVGLCSIEHIARGVNAACSADQLRRTEKSSVLQGRVLCQIRQQKINQDPHTRGQTCAVRVKYTHAGVTRQALEREHFDQFPTMQRSMSMMAAQARYAHVKQGGVHTNMAARLQILRAIIPSGGSLSSRMPTSKPSRNKSTLRSFRLKSTCSWGYSA